MYDDKKIKFNKNCTKEETISKLYEKIFDNPKYQAYYGFIGSDGNAEREIKNNVDYTEERWLGIKPVGKDKAETVKFTLDLISWLILTYNIHPKLPYSSVQQFDQSHFYFSK